jgi:hypothetical protein
MSHAEIPLYKPGATDAVIADKVAVASMAAKTADAITWLLGEDGRPESAIVPVSVAESYEEMREQLKDADLDALRAAISKAADEGTADLGELGRIIAGESAQEGGS